MYGFKNGLLVKKKILQFFFIYIFGPSCMGAIRDYARSRERRNFVCLAQREARRGETYLRLGRGGVATYGSLLMELWLWELLFEPYLFKCKNLKNLIPDDLVSFVHR